MSTTTTIISETKASSISSLSLPSVLPATYRAVQIISPGQLKLNTLPLKLPKEYEVLVRVISCGLCHSDSMMVGVHLPGMELPRVPGHEVIGYVAAVGTSVTRFKIGDKVGRGWHGGHCFQCDACSDGQFFGCSSPVGPTGATTDGGYAEYMIAPYESLARIPEGVSMNTGGPLMCAGMTVYNSLRNTGVRSGEVVAIQGLGGLGHLGVQYARAMGAVTVAISTSAAKAELAKELGAHHYIDTSKQDVVAELKKLGGAKVILATAFDSKSQSALIPGLGLNGQLLPLGIDFSSNVQVPPLPTLMNRSSVRGWYAGTAKDAEDTAKFSALAGVKVKSEVYPFEKFQEAYDRMMSGKAIFRVVLAIAPEAEPVAASPAKKA